MEYATENAQEKKDRVKLLKKINLVRKHKGVMLLYDLIGENGRQLTNYGRIAEESSSLSWKRGKIIIIKPTK